jgi:hypothetical protein
MTFQNTKKGAALTAPCARSGGKEAASIYPLEAKYRKPNRFALRDKPLTLKGGRALVLDLLIAAKPAGIDRSATLQWVANLSDTICALRAHGIMIETRKGQAANYALISDVRRIGGAQ